MGAKSVFHEKALHGPIKQHLDSCNPYVDARPRPVTYESLFKQHVISRLEPLNHKSTKNLYHKRIETMYADFKARSGGIYLAFQMFDHMMNKSAIKQFNWKGVEMGSREFSGWSKSDRVSEIFDDSCEWAFPKGFLPPHPPEESESPKETARL